MTNDIIILAAGKGTRMRSARAKVLQLLAGLPLLQHVINTAKSLPESRLHVVIGHDSDAVQHRFAKEQLSFVEQREQLGTGHAVAQALPVISEQGKTLVLYGDVPLVSRETLTNLLNIIDDNAMAVLTVMMDDPKGYGRIIRNEQGIVTAIVEEKDATDTERQVKECNSGIIAISNKQLRHYLPLIGNNNAQKEYYLTDLISLMANDGKTVHGIEAQSVAEVTGVNDRKQLAQLERALQAMRAEALLVQGVTLLDPARIDIRGELHCGQDVLIDVNCVFQGTVTLGNNVSIGPNCVIGEIGKTVVIGDDCEIKANSVIEEAVIGADCSIGPFARIRPGTKMAKGVKVGNFVETKKADLGEGSKVSHLTYIGDAVLGKDVNVGAGTITCNYDGVNKFQTTIGDGAFIGSNTSLVAPVEISSGATIGAGSVITANVKENELAVGRAKQRNIQGWARPEKK